MGKSLKEKVNGHILRRILIAIFCVFIAATTVYVMLYLYKPNKNALGALGSVCMDLICIIILYIVIGSFAFGEYNANRTTRVFAVLLVATIWAIYLDFLNWAFDGSLELGHLTYWFTACSLCMGAIIAGIYTTYVYSYIEATYHLTKMRTSAYVCAGLNLASFVLTAVLALTGTAFKFVDGHYEVGALYDYVMVIPILTVLYMMGYVAYNYKVVGLHDTVAISGYLLFMIVGAIIESEYRIGTTYVSVAIADIFIFLVLQNEIIAREKRNVLKWMKRSKTDELTGFYNRHAYEDDVDMLDKGGVKDNFVYVSVDVNSLKVVNDSLGHYAGDELLVGAAECLNKCFGQYGKVYRIGGDEFVALIYADKDLLNRLKVDLMVITDKWRGNLVEELAISCGYVTKTEVASMTVRQMAILADQRMYEAKKDYYRKQGVDRRNGGDRRKS